MLEVPTHKSKVVGISMLLLSVLLTTTVAALIYMAVSNSHKACSNTAPAVEEPEEVNVKATVNLKSEQKTVSIHCIIICNINNCFSHTGSSVYCFVF